MKIAGLALVGLLLWSHAEAISYRCDNNQILIVQNFGNDTIRMHCQRLNICGFDHLNCDYEHKQPTCGGKFNFVSHVHQVTATGPVEHTCCLLKQKEDISYENDCFVYELPDGSHDKKLKEKIDNEITVLKNANQIPEQFDGYVGYRMRLFMLRNKSPPTLIVKAIERVPAGYRVTICRPRCGKFANEGLTEQVQKGTKEAEKNKEAEKDKGEHKDKDKEEGDEWAAAAWSSWQTSTWSTWSKTTWSAWQESSAEKSSGTRGRSRANRVGHDSGDAGENGSATAIASAKAENGNKADLQSQGGGNAPIIHNNIHVHAEGGRGGQGGHASIVLPDGEEAKAVGKNGKKGKSPGEDDAADDDWNITPDSKDKSSKGKHEDDDSDEEAAPASKRGKGKKNNGKKNDNDNGAEANPDEDGSDESESISQRRKKNKNGKPSKERKPSDNDNNGDDDNDGDDDDTGAQKPKGRGKGDGKEKGKGKSNKNDSDEDATANGKGNGDDEADNENDGDNAPELRNKKPSSGDKNGKKGNGKGSKGGKGNGDNDGNNVKEGEGDDNDNNGAKKPEDSDADKNDNGKGKGKGKAGDGNGDKGDADTNKAGNGKDGDDKSDGKKNGDDNESGKDNVQGNNADKDGNDGQSKGNDNSNNGGDNHDSGKDGEAGSKKSAKDGETKEGEGRGPAHDGESAPEGVPKDSGLNQLNNGEGKGDKNEDGKANGDNDNKTIKWRPLNGDSDEEDNNGKKNGDEQKDNGDGADGKGAEKDASDADGWKDNGDGDAKKNGNAGKDNGDGADGNDDSDEDGGKKAEDGDNDGKGDSKFSGIINSKENKEDSNEENKSAEETTEASKVKETSEGGFVVEVNAGHGTESKESEEDKKDGEHGGAELPWCDEEVAYDKGSGEGSGEAHDDTLGAGFTGIVTESSGEEEEEEEEEKKEGIGAVLAHKPLNCRPRPDKHSSKPKPTSTEKPTHPKGHGHGHEHGHSQRPPSRAHAAVQHSPKDKTLQWQDSAGPEGFIQSNLRNCFSGDTVVRTATGTKEMKDLQVGDLVLVPSSDNALKYERVEMFYHREPETYVKFVQLNTESGKSLSLTPLHLLPFGDCAEMEQDSSEGDKVDEWMRKSRYAQKAQAGECLMTLGDNGEVSIEKIVKVGRRYSKGIYSPVTVEGAIITNDILSSCFSQIESHAVQKMAFDVLMMFYRAFGYLEHYTTEAVQDIPAMLDYVHQLSWHILPFAKY